MLHSEYRQWEAFGHCASLCELPDCSNMSYWYKTMRVAKKMLNGSRSTLYKLVRVLKGCIAVNCNSMTFYRSFTHNSSNFEKCLSFFFFFLQQHLKSFCVQSIRVPDLWGWWPWPSMHFDPWVLLVCLSLFLHLATLCVHQPFFLTFFLCSVFRWFFLWS